MNGTKQSLACLPEQVSEKSKIIFYCDMNLTVAKTLEI